MSTTFNEALGVYIHVPFCATTCDYCAFYQEQGTRSDVLRYLQGLHDEIATWEHQQAVDTIFIGGGTPGLLTARDLECLGDSIAKIKLKDNCEFSIEMAPSTVKVDKLAVLKAIGVTRISLGVQSFDDALLEQMGRRQSPKLVYQAYERIREAGFLNVNLDLIFAIPGQGIVEWEKDLQQAIDMRPEHISTYCLTFEDDTALWAKLTRGEVRRDEVVETKLYRRTWEMLEAAGYKQYEVSNFASPMHECRHNLDTWKMQQWRGFGPSAASQWQMERFSNPASLDQWLADIGDASLRDKCDVVALSDAVLVADSLIFGLRLNQGVNLDEIQQRFPAIDLALYENLWVDLQESAYILRRGEYIKLTVEGRLRADAIASAINERQ